MATSPGPDFPSLSRWSSARALWNEMANQAALSCILGNKEGQSKRRKAQEPPRISLHANSEAGSVS